MYRSDSKHNEHALHATPFSTRVVSISSPDVGQCSCKLLSPPRPIILHEDLGHYAPDTRPTDSKFGMHESELELWTSY